MPSDITNREGHSAKVYFNAIFGQEFQRREENNINGALNYGYAVMLVCFNREIVRLGYLTQLGIWHKNELTILIYLAIYLSHFAYLSIERCWTLSRTPMIETLGLEF